MFINLVSRRLLVVIILAECNQRDCGMIDQRLSLRASKRIKRESDPCDSVRPLRVMIRIRKLRDDSSMRGYDGVRASPSMCLEAQPPTMRP